MRKIKLGDIVNWFPIGKEDTYGVPIEYRGKRAVVIITEYAAPILPFYIKFEHDQQAWWVSASSVIKANAIRTSTMVPFQIGDRVSVKMPSGIINLGTIRDTAPLGSKHEWLVQMDEDPYKLIPYSSSEIGLVDSYYEETIIQLRREVAELRNAIRRIALITSERT